MLVTVKQYSKSSIALINIVSGDFCEKVMCTWLSITYTYNKKNENNNNVLLLEIMIIIIIFFSFVIIIKLKEVLLLLYSVTKKK